jgi:hypothetical protein
MVLGLLQIDHVDQVFDNYLIGKQRRLLFPKGAKYHATFKLELMHGDLCGMITPVTPSDKWYFFLPIDVLSRYMWLTLLGMKDEATTVFKVFQARAQVKGGRKLDTLCTDHDHEFKTHDFLDHRVNHNIQCHFTAFYTLEQNRVVERHNRSILGMKRSMIKAMSMLGWF